MVFQLQLSNIYFFPSTLSFSDHNICVCVYIYIHTHTHTHTNTHKTHVRALPPPYTHTHTHTRCTLCGTNNVYLFSKHSVFLIVYLCTNGKKSVAQKEGGHIHCCYHCCCHQESSSSHCFHPIDCTVFQDCNLHGW